MTYNVFNALNLLLCSISKLKSGRRIAGVEATPHTLRHTLRPHAIEEGVDIATLQSLRGHSCTETTRRYLCLSAERLQETLEELQNTKGHFVSNLFN